MCFEREDERKFLLDGEAKWWLQNGALGFSFVKESRANKRTLVGNIRNILEHNGW